MSTKKIVLGKKDFERVVSLCERKAPVGERLRKAARRLDFNRSNF